MGTATLVIVAVAGALVGLTSLLWGLGRRDARSKRLTRDAWAEAARELQLPRADPPGGQRIAGTIEGFAVTIESQPAQGRLRARLEGGGRIARGLRIEGAKLWSAPGFGPLVRMGEADFDRLVRVAGPEVEALAALKAEARAAALPFVGEGGTVAEGDLELVVEFRQEPAQLVWAARHLVALARGLAVGSVPDALLENATKDPDPGLRGRNLSALAQGWPGTRETLWALQACLRDLNPGLRRLAASLLPGAPEARGALVELADNGELEPSLRARALEDLAAAYPYPEVAPVVGRALASAAAELRCAAIDAVATAGDGSRLEALIALAEGAPEASVGESLARALGRLGGPLAEAALLTLLAHEAKAVQEAVARALGAAGSIRAVEPLLVLASGGPVADAARDAVRAIQARLGDAGAGRLSVLAEGGPEGAVSLENPIPGEAAEEGE